MRETIRNSEQFAIFALKNDVIRRAEAEKLSFSVLTTSALATRWRDLHIFCSGRRVLTCYPIRAYSRMLNDTHSVLPKRLGSASQGRFLYSAQV